ncbi:arylesterase [Pontibacter pamirensis]|uniref:arylesterase n=1 Tax=Pontibacter pamirensis TaxID=2562824 RepID=UPI00138A1854|nr:arylesterase [Pontibacter pamirensis]
MKIENSFLTICLASIMVISGCGNVNTADQLEAEQETRIENPRTEAANTESGTKTILFFGNSLTAGYGLEPEQAFPALIQQRIDSMNLSYKVINAGVSGETTSGGKSRIDWLLKQPVDVFVLELGANDGLRGVSTEESYNNLKAIIGKVRAKYPDVKVVLAGMQIPPSMGQQYAQDFREIYTRIAEEENVALIPFLLEGVAGNSELNQGDGIHPTEEGQKILAENVWDTLEPIVQEEEVQEEEV